MHRTASIAVIAILGPVVAGCSTTARQPPPEQYVWARADGQAITGTLLEQSRTDAATCRAEAAEATGADESDVIVQNMQPCMEARGYVLRTLGPGDPYTEL